MTEEQAASMLRADEHARALMREFDEEEIDVAIESIAIFLAHAYRSTLEPADVTFDDFATEIGRALGEQHLIADGLHRANVTET